MAASCWRCAQRPPTRPPGRRRCVGRRSPGRLGEFSSAPDPGPVRLATAVRKRGRRISVVDVELIQADRTAVRAAVTVGVPEEQAEPLLVANPVVGPDDTGAAGRHGADRPGPSDGRDQPPGGRLRHPARVVDLPFRGERTAGGAAAADPDVGAPRDLATDALFALTAGDISMPVTFAVGRTGWAPTVQLTAYLRGVPADGWLRVVCTTTQIGQTGSTPTTPSSTGRPPVVVQTRQLAMVPPRTAVRA